MVERVIPVLIFRLAEDVHDDFAFDDAETAGFDCSLQLVGAALDDGIPVIAPAVRLVHGELCTRAVLIAGVLGQDRADQRIEHRWGVSAAGDVVWRDDCVGTTTFAVDGCEDAMGAGAFLRRRMRE